LYKFNFYTNKKIPEFQFCRKFAKFKKERFVGKEVNGKGKTCPILTIEKVREFKGFENVSNEEAEHIIQTLQQFAYIAYEHYVQCKKLKKEKNERPIRV
jgi:hypothetical protein